MPLMRISYAKVKGSNDIIVMIIVVATSGYLERCVGGRNGGGCVSSAQDHATLC